MKRDKAREKILRGISQCAKKLGRAPSYTELLGTVKVTRREIRKHFATYTAAVRACGLERKGSGHEVPLDVLFKDWAGVARKVKRLPTVAEYELHGKYSVQPLFRRFGSWKQTPLGLMLYAQEQGLEKQWSDVLEMVKAGAGKRSGNVSRRLRENKRAALRKKSKIMPDRPTYGRPMVEGPLANEPDNEQAVVFLFGAMARELGFVAVKVRMGYPDCEAWREVAPEVWQKVNIEIEHESRNFVKHLHDVKKCDLIVCWKHNWKECPLEVVALVDQLAAIRK
ncbi:MAG TPA: hypothetical protein VIB39_03395 [Candidatus Angelobacter sp.]